MTDKLGKPLLSVVIPCRNEAGHITTVLEALRRQECDGFEVVVADGQSDDGTVAVIEAYAAAHPALSLRVLENEKRNIPAGLNTAIRHAQGAIVARLDGHCRPAKNYLRLCVTVLQESGAELVGGAWDVAAGGDNATARAIALAVSSPLGAGDAVYRLPGVRAGQDVDTVPFGCFRRSMWESVGGYDEALLTNEDYEFALRIRRQGGRVRFDPRIRSTYFARASWGALVRQYWRYGWWKAQMLKRYPSSVRWRQMVPMAWSSVGVLLLVAAMVLPWGWLVALAMWGSYLLALIVGGVQQLVSVGCGVALLPLLVVTYILIHFSWGLGAWAGLVLGWNGAGLRNRGGR